MSFVKKANKSSGDQMSKNSNLYFEKNAFSEENDACRFGSEVKRKTMKGCLFSSTFFAGTVGAAFILATGVGDALAGPEGASVVGGSATVSGVGTGAVTINQSSERAVIDWRSYSIDLSESVRYNQPGASSISLNRVTGGSSSQILGSLSANGQVWLVNPAGIFFGAGAQVDVGGLLATTTNISNDSFMAGVYNFDEATSSRGAVVLNRGDISVADGGLVAFVAPGVGNSGAITANFGAVTLASGDAFTFDLFGDSLVNLTASASEISQLKAADGTALAAQIVQEGLINAGGGKVTLSVQSASALVDNAISMSGIIQARAVSQRGGAIVLSGGETGTVLVSGTLDASGNDAGQFGGSVKVLGDKVGLIETASLDVSGASGGGEILVGGNFQGSGSEQTAAFTFVGPDVSLKADALIEGDGGRVIVWSDNTTRFSGDIKARGGSAGGNGGFAEVSGKQFLVFRGTADLTAASGSGGSILFDPKNITIANGGADVVANNDLFADNAAADATFDADQLDALNASVALQANNDITISEAINLTTNAASLTLQAGRDVVINASITTNDADINITANDAAAGAANRDAGTGDITMANSTVLNAGNGLISLAIGAGTTANAGTAGNISAETLTTTGNVTLNVAADSGGTATRDITVSQALVNVSALSIVNADDVTFAAITAATVDQDAGTGTTTFSAAVNTSGIAGVIVENLNLAVNNTVDTTGGGVVTFNQSGTTTIAAAGVITSDGAVTITSTGGTTTSGDITTTADAIQFASNTTLGGAVVITTTAGAGNILFSGTLDGAQALTLTAGTGNVTFTGAVGGTTRLGTLNIVSASDVNAQSVSSNSMLFFANNVLTGTYDATTTVDFTAANNIEGISVTADSAQIRAGQAIVNASIVAANVTVQGGISISLINTSAGGFSAGDAFKGITLNEPFTLTGSYTVNAIPFGPSRAAVEESINKALAAVSLQKIQLAVAGGGSNNNNELDRAFASDALAAPYMIRENAYANSIVEISSDIFGKDGVTK